MEVSGNELRFEYYVKQREHLNAEERMMRLIEGVSSRNGGADSAYSKPHVTKISITLRDRVTGIADLEALTKWTRMYGNRTKLAWYQLEGCVSERAETIYKQMDDVRRAIGPSYEDGEHQRDFFDAILKDFVEKLRKETGITNLVEIEQARQELKACMYPSGDKTAPFSARLMGFHSQYLCKFDKLMRLKRMHENGSSAFNVEDPVGNKEDRKQYFDTLLNSKRLPSKVVDAVHTRQQIQDLCQEQMSIKMILDQIRVVADQVQNQEIHREQENLNKPPVPPVENKSGKHRLYNVGEKGASAKDQKGGKGQ
jgi:hypothetical protein